MVRMITIQQASIETGLTVSALRAGITNGTYPAIRVGSSGRGKFMIEANELNRVLIDLARRNVKSNEVNINLQLEAESPHEVAKGDNIDKKKIVPFTRFNKIN
jgi:hypothetical protein